MAPSNNQVPHLQPLPSSAVAADRLPLPICAVPGSNCSQQSVNAANNHAAADHRQEDDEKSSKSGQNDAYFPQQSANLSISHHVCHHLNQEDEEEEAGKKLGANDVNCPQVPADYAALHGQQEERKLGENDDSAAAPATEATMKSSKDQTLILPPELKLHLTTTLGLKSVNIHHSAPLKDDRTRSGTKSISDMAATYSHDLSAPSHLPRDLSGHTHGGFFAKLRRSFTVGSSHNHRNFLTESPSTKKSSNEHSTGVFARLRRSFTLTSRHNSTPNSTTTEAADYLHRHRNGIDLRAHSNSHSRRVHGHRRSASITAPLKKMRDSYVSCLIAVDSQLVDSGIAGGGGVGNLYQHHYFTSSASVSRRQKSGVDELGCEPLNLAAAAGGGDILRYPSEARIREALRNSKHFQEAIPE